MKKLFILISFSLIFGQSAFVGEQLAKGSINYADRKIQATGIGYVPDNMINAATARRSATRIAKVDAMRNLVEIVNGITVDSETTMSDAMFDDVVKTKVQGLIRGAVQVGDIKYLSDTSIEVTYEVPMSGVSEIMMPPTGFLPTAAAAPAITDASAATTTSATTGLIIDARGLGIRPAMSPRILDQNGGVVYGPGNYTREYSIQNGVAGYAKGLDKAQADDRVKGNPLVIKGVATSGANKADVVVGNSEVMKIRTANSTGNVLRDCRVLFVLD
ncbi:MAG: hypothetical protein QGH91_05430 [Candidatus Marinimicrobia bacterium]|jgi:hypothetical protein|nr:hypothetical protein [Candidatus Neomarinimicrobiota bacterium]MDP7437235.1 hypothetical protein [Candidatus Neomarinimicrobiota bacterium]|tara:strand:+ start:333 stop:1151 length:819 start_codon:yes stop_codon:yes gene_type:complete